MQRIIPNPLIAEVSDALAGFTRILKLDYIHGVVLRDPQQGNRRKFLMAPRTKSDECWFRGVWEVSENLEKDSSSNYLGPDAAATERAEEGLARLVA